MAQSQLSVQDSESSTYVEASDPISSPCGSTDDQLDSEDGDSNRLTASDVELVVGELARGVLAGCLPSRCSSPGHQCLASGFMRTCCRECFEADEAFYSCPEANSLTSLRACLVAKGCRFVGCSGCRDVVNEMDPGADEMLDDIPEHQDAPAAEPIIPLARASSLRKRIAARLKSVYAKVSGPSQLSRVLTKFEGALDVGADAVGSANARLGPLMASIAQIHSAVSGRLDALTNSSVVQTLKSHKRVVGFFVLVFVAILAAAKARSFITSHILPTLEMLVGLGCDALSAAVSAIRKTLSYLSGKTTSQSPGNDKEVVCEADLSGPSVVLAAALTLFGLPSGMGKTEALSMALTRVTRLAAGVAVAEKGVTWLFSQLPDVITQHLDFLVGPDHIDDEELKFLTTELCNLNSRQARESVVCMSDREFCTNAVAAYERLSAYAPQVLAHFPSSSPIRTFVHTTLQEAKSYIGICSATVSGFSTRQTPVGVYLYGTGGVGKSSCVSNLLARLYPEVMPSQRAWFKNEVDAFSTGYTNQPVAVIDDYACSADSRRRANELVPMISSNPYTLNMAFKKGVVFTSEVVIVTSNLPINADQPDVTDAGAFLRRFLAFEMSLNPDWLKPGTTELDVLRLEALYASDPTLGASLPHLVFKHQMCVKGERGWVSRPARGTLTYLQVVTMIQAARARFAANFRARLAIDSATEAAALAANPVPPPAVVNEMLTDFADERKACEASWADIAAEPQPEEQKYPDKAIPGRPTPLASASLPPSWTGQIPQGDPSLENSMRVWSFINGVAQKCMRAVLAGHRDRTRLALEYALLVAGFNEGQAHVYSFFCPTEAVGRSIVELAYNNQGNFADLTKWKDRPLFRAEVLSLLGCADSRSAVVTGLFYQKALAHYREARRAQMSLGDRISNYSTSSSSLFKDPCEASCEELDRPAGIAQMTYAQAAQYLWENPLETPAAKPGKLTWSGELARFREAARLKLSRIPLKPVLAGIAAFAATAGVISFATGAFRSSDTEEEDEVEPEAYGAGGKKGSMKGKAKPLRKFRFNTGKRAFKFNSRGYNSRGFRHVRSEATRSDRELAYGEQVKLGNVAAKINSNMGFLKRNKSTLRCFVARDRFVISTRHFFYDLEKGGIIPDGTPFVVEIDGTATSESFEYDRLTEVKAEGSDALLDICSYRLSDAPPRQNILSHFASEASLNESLELDDPMLLTAAGDCIRLEYAYREDSPVEWKMFNDEAAPLITDSFWAYDHHGAGTCGSLLVDCTRDKGPIVGMHVGRIAVEGAPCGMAISVTRELLEGLCSANGSEVFCEGLVLPFEVESRDPPIQLGNKFNYLGVLKNQTSGLPGKTKLAKSLIYDYVDSKVAASYQPAYLGDPSDPRRTTSPVTVALEALAKGGNPVGLFPHDDVALAILDMHVQTGANDWNGPRRALSLHEALNPGDSFPALKGLDMSTSPGYGHLEDRPVGEKGKKFLFAQAEDGQWSIASEKLLRLYHELIATVRGGKMYTLVAMLAAKDELRAVAPAGVGPDGKRAEATVKNAREIDVLPVEYNIALKVYFGAFVNFYHSIHRSTYSGVGMNMYSEDWDFLIRRMLTVSPVGFDGDYSGFQDFLTQQLMGALRARFERFYAQGELNVEDALIREGLLRSLIHHYVLVGPHVIERFFGNSTGNWLTAILNTELNALLTRLCWLGIMRANKPEYATLEAFNRWVAEKYWGDDLMLAVNPSLGSIFNALSVQKFFRGYGIKFTPASKEEHASEKLVSVLELSFLSNTTTRVDHVPPCQYAAKVDPAKRAKSLLYINSTLPAAAAIVDNVNDSLRRTFSSGPEAFKLWRAECESMLLSAGVKAQLISYAECYALWKTSGVCNEYVGSDTLYDTARPQIKRVAARHSGSFSSRAKAWRDGCARRRKDPITVDIVNEMDNGTTPGPVTAEETESVVAIGAGSEAVQTPSPLPRQRLKSFRQLLKRFSKFLNGDALNLSSGITVSKPLAAYDQGGVVQAGWMTYLSPMYRFYKGSMRFKFIGEYDLQLQYMPYVAEAAATGFPGTLMTSTGRRTGMGPTAVGRDTTGLLEIQIPYYNHQNQLIIPRYPADLITRPVETGMGALVFVRDDPGADDNFGGVYVAGGDDMRFFYLMQVPSVECLLIGDCIFPHRLGVVVEVPETVTFTMTEDIPVPSPFRFTQPDLALRYTPLNTPGGINTLVATFTIPSSQLTNQNLNDLGIPIGPGQTREIQVGVNADFNYDATNVSLFWASEETRFTSGTTGAAAYLQLFGGVPGPTGSTTVLNPTTGKEYQVADSWTFPKANFENPSFAAYLGGGPSTLLFPFVTTATTFLAVGPSITVGGETFHPFDVGSDYAVRPAPPVAASSSRAPRPVLKGPFRVTNEMDTGGVSFNDSVETKTDGGRPMVAVTPTTDMQEANMGFTALATRMQFVRNINWTSSQPAGTILTTLSAPWDMLTSNTNSTPFQTFVYWNGSIELKMTLQTNAFQQGLLIAYFVPLTTTEEIARHISSSPTSQILCPHAFLSAGSSESVSLKIPFNHPLTRLDLDRRASQFLGTIVIQVFSPLRTGPDGSLTANLSIWGSFPYSDFQVLNPSRESLLSQGGFLSAVARYHSVRGAAARGSVVNEGNAITKVTNQTTNITNAANGTVDYANSTHDAMESKAESKNDMGGMDVPNIGLIGEIAILNKVGPLSNVVGITRHQVLDSFPGQTSEISENLVASSQDEMSLDYLLSKSSWLRTVEWGVDNPEGTILTYGELLPNPNYADAGYGQKFTPTLQGYLSQPFALWRGPLKFRFQIVSALQTGRLAFCTHYGRSANTIELTDALAQYAHVHDLASGSDSFEVIVPWKAPSPYLRVAGGRPPDMTAYSMGEWSLRVVNSLNAPSTVSQRVQVLVFVSCGENFELHFAGDNSADFVSGQAS